MPESSPATPSPEISGRSPRYMRIQRDIRRQIETGQFLPSDTLPPERELAEDYKVSRITIRKAIEGLVEEGLLTRKQGSGTFIAARVEKHFSKLTSFSEDMSSRGMVAGNRWLSRSVGAVTPQEAITMGLSPGTTVYRFARIREADGIPMALDYSTILASALPKLEFEGDSLYSALDATKSRPVRALQRLRAVLLDDEKAALLGVAANSPGLLIERCGFVQDGTPVELNHSWYRGDSYDVIAELKAGQP